MSTTDLGFHGAGSIFCNDVDICICQGSILGLRIDKHSTRGQQRTAKSDHIVLSSTVHSPTLSVTAAASEDSYTIDGEKDTAAAQVQDSDSQLVKPTLALLAALRREHRGPTESGTGKPPVRGASRVVDALWSAESAAPIVQCYFLGIHLNTIPARRQIAQGERGVCRGAPAARAALGVYYLGQRVASIAGAEEQEPVRHGVPGSALLGLCDAQGHRTGSSCLRQSNLPFVALLRNASTGLQVHDSTCRTSFTRRKTALHGTESTSICPCDGPF